MKVRQRMGTTEIEVEDSTMIGAMKQLSAASEVFGQTVCGACDSESVRFVARSNKGFDFFEVACNSCGCRLSFGQSKDGKTLFPKRKHEDGSWMDNNGWVKPPSRRDADAF